MVEEYVALSVEEVDGALDEAVLHIVAPVQGVRRAVCVLIGKHGASVHDVVVHLGVEGKGLRSVQMACPPGVLEGDALQIGVLGMHHHRGSHVHGRSVGSAAHTVIAHADQPSRLSHEMQVRLGSRDVKMLVVVSRLDIYNIRCGGRVGRRVNGVLYRGKRAGSVLRHNTVEHFVVCMKLGGQHRESGKEKPFYHEVFHIYFAFV